MLLLTRAGQTPYTRKKSTRRPSSSIAKRPNSNLKIRTRTITGASLFTTRSCTQRRLSNTERQRRPIRIMRLPTTTGVTPYTTNRGTMRRLRSTKKQSSSTPSLSIMTAGSNVWKSWTKKPSARPLRMSRKSLPVNQNTLMSTTTGGSPFTIAKGTAKRLRNTDGPRSLRATTLLRTTIGV